MQAVFLQGQADEDLGCRRAAMLGKEQGKAFQFGCGTVVFSELKEVQAKGIEVGSGRVVPGRSSRLLPDQHKASEET